MATDIDARALWDGRKTYEEFRASDSPKMVKAADAKFLINDEYVLGITVNGQSRAYPTRFAAWHHVINDRIPDKTGKNETRIAITFCVVCNSGVAFYPEIDGRALRLDFYGLYNGVLTMYDHETNSVWLQVGGRAVKGKLLGKHLKSAALLDTTWGRWKALHPDTRVMAPEPYYRRYYEAKGTILQRGYDQFPAAYFERTLTRRDSRLPMFSMVLALSVPAEVTPAKGQDSSAGRCNPSSSLRRAYPIGALHRTAGVVNDSVGDVKVGILFEPETETAAAFSREIDGRILTLEAHKRAKGGPRFVDRETGTEWNIEGLGISGLLAGRSLQRLDWCLSQWYGWAAYYPETSIFGQPEPKSAATSNNGTTAGAAALTLLR